MNKKGFTLVEALIATVIAVLLFASSMGAYLFTKTMVNRIFVQNDFSEKSNFIMSKIIRGYKEGAGLYGLRSASSFTIQSATELSYVSIDGQTRRYFVSGSSLIYESPAQWPTQQTVYTPPAGSTFTLRFWEPAGYSGNETIGIYVGLIQTINGKNVSSSVTSYINIRNLPK